MCPCDYTVILFDENIIEIVGERKGPNAHWHKPYKQLRHPYNTSTKCAIRRCGKKIVNQESKHRRVGEEKENGE